MAAANDRPAAAAAAMKFGRLLSDIFGEASTRGSNAGDGATSSPGAPGGGDADPRPVLRYKVGSLWGWVGRGRGP